MSVTILVGDVVDRLRDIPAASVHCLICSPPYWGLRDYGVKGQLGLEATPQEHVAAMVGVFREVKRVMRPDGVVWVNYGDCYATAPNGRSAADTRALGIDDRSFRDKPSSTAVGGLKAKDMALVPERFALAMQADGWWVRSRLPWVKRNSMPESIHDRPATAVEYVFMFTLNGNRPLWWRHEVSREWVEGKRPAQEYRWRHRLSRELYVEAPADPLEEVDGKKLWSRVPMWVGFDYWYDGDAVKVKASPNTHARLAQDVANQAGSNRANGGAKANGTMKAVIGRQVYQERKPVGGWFQDTPESERVRGMTPREVRGRDTHGRHTLGENVPEAERRQPNFSGAGRKYEGHSSRTTGGGGASTLRDLEKRPRRGSTPRHTGHTSSCDQSSLDSVGRVGRPKAVERGSLIRSNDDLEAHTSGQMLLARNFRNSDLFYESLAAPHGLLVDEYGNPLALDVPPQPFRDAHFATFPPNLIRPLMLASCPPGGTVLDIFGGAGTTALVADQLGDGRKVILIELNPKYAEIARGRVERGSPLLSTVTVSAAAE